MTVLRRLHLLSVVLPTVSVPMIRRLYLPIPYLLSVVLPIVSVPTVRRLHLPTLAVLSLLHPPQFSLLYYFPDCNSYLRRIQPA